MSVNPLISVVLPVYNVENYIKECMDSILNQTFQDFEILVIDDCSTDNTINLIESYNDSRIIIKKKPVNKGLIDSLNIGFKLAKGKYIARMDGDDISNLNRFQKQKDILENNQNIDVCGCWFQEFGKREMVMKHKEKHEEIVAEMLLSCSMSMASVLINRKAIKDYNFDENKRHVEDYDFWSRVAWSVKFYNIQEVLYRYRIHESQVSTVYKAVQTQGDVLIKLFLFKKLNYSQEKFSDVLISKMLLLNESISITDFVLFNKWLKKMVLLNNKTLVYSKTEFEEVLERIKIRTIFLFYFSNKVKGVTKAWRLKALFRMPIKEVVFILKIKSREIIKTKFKVL